MKVNILGTDYKIHFVDEFPEYLKEVGEGADGLWLNDPLKMVYCSIINNNHITNANQSIFYIL